MAYIYKRGPYKVTTIWVQIINDQATQQRKQIYVSKAIQGRLLMRFCIYWVVYHLFLVLVISINAMLSSTHPQSLAQLGSMLWQEHFWTFALITAAFPIIFRDMVKTTHRIAGPLVRFERVLTEMVRGKRVEQVQLRKHDMLFDLQDSFNEFIDVYNNQVESAEKQDESTPIGERELAGHLDEPLHYS